MAKLADMLLQSGTPLMTTPFAVTVAFPLRTAVALEGVTEIEFVVVTKVPVVGCQPAGNTHVYVAPVEATQL